MVGRVVARSGQTVDIDNSSLYIDARRITELDIDQETNQVNGGVTFPLTVPDGQVFVLGDNRTKATDSRSIGCIEVDKTDGKVIGLFRHRGL